MRPKNSERDRFIPRGRLRAAAGAQFERIPPSFPPLPELDSLSVLSPELTFSRERDESVFEPFDDDCSGDGFSVASGTLTTWGSSLDSADDDTMRGRALVVVTGALSCCVVSGRTKGGGTWLSGQVVLFGASCTLSVIAVSEGMSTEEWKGRRHRLTRFRAFINLRLLPCFKLCPSLLFFSRCILHHLLQLPLLLLSPLCKLKRLVLYIISLNTRSILPILVAATCSRRIRTRTAAGCRTRLKRHRVGVYKVQRVKKGGWAVMCRR